MRDWKAEWTGLNLHLLEALEAQGVRFAWRKREGSSIWFDFESICAGRIIEQALHEAGGSPRDTTEWVVYKTAQRLQQNGLFACPIDLTTVSVSDEWVPRPYDFFPDRE